MSPKSDIFGAAEPGLGYIYQIRYALLQMLQLPEGAACYMEKDDDLDFTQTPDGKVLASLKHKAFGDRLTDLSPDFWKSVRIWLVRFAARKPGDEPLNFSLCTTGVVAEDSFLKHFLPGVKKPTDVAQLADDILGQTTSVTILKSKSLFDELSEDEKTEFLSLITIFDYQERIDEVPDIIKGRMRTVRPKFRDQVYERLEGWWLNLSINLMTGGRQEPAYVMEVTEKLVNISEQFRDDNLPIDFFGAEPDAGVDPDGDSRLFVEQLRCVGLKTNRIRRAILDYYRAFEQRAKWARELDLALSGELELYDDKLVDEWDRMKEIVWEDIEDTSSPLQFEQAGRDLLKWFEMNNHEDLRIRPLVTEPYVMMGSYHMLANDHRPPRVHWHPRFNERLESILTTES